MDNSKLLLGMGLGLLVGGFIGCMALKCHLMKCACRKMCEMKENACRCNEMAAEKQQ